MQKNYRPSSIGMLPAAAGTCLVQAFFDAGTVEVVRANVIGWQVHMDRSLAPLVVDPRAADADEWCVQHPDGRVECASGGAWHNEDAWLDELRRLRREAA